MPVRQVLVVQKLLGRRIPCRLELLLRMPRNSVCAEIGVYKGDFSQMILKIVKPRKLYLIDPWKYESDKTYKKALYGGKRKGQEEMDRIYYSVLNRFEQEINSGIVTICRVSSEKSAHDFSDNYFDWVYIDGNHLYEYVKKDLELYYPKVRPGGFITGDDYGVVGWWNNGVQRAVDEFVKVRNLRLDVIESQFIIHKPRV